MNESTRIDKHVLIGHQVTIKDVYVLAAFNVEEEKSIKYQKYKTLEGLAKGVIDAMKLNADYVSLRRIQPKGVTE